jgi:AbrB family looped-hinge helix DNA binding protein
MNAVLSEKGQITIPKAIRDLLGLVPGSVLDFQATQGSIVVSKVLGQDPIQSWRGKGKLPVGQSVMEYLEIQRGGK